MKILLQDTATGLYLSRGGGWSNNPDGALAFLSELRAADFRVYHHLASTRVVLWADAGDPNVPGPEPNGAADSKLKM